jgi:hypothetical protein
MVGFGTTKLTRAREPALLWNQLTRSRLPSSRRHRYTINGVISPVLGLVPKVTVPGLSRR